MCIEKQKQTHRYREQTSGYQRAEGRGEGQIRGIRLRIETTIYKMDKQQKYIVQHRELYPLSYNNF